MRTESKFIALLVLGALFLPLASRADTTPSTRAHSKKKALPAPLPSGTQGPVPQVPLDAIPAVAPQVSYEDGLLTIVAPNSTLGDILRSVRKHTSAEIEVPATASERVVMRLGPAPAREVMAELLNGSRFNYVLLGSPQDANALTRVVLVAKTSAEPANGSQPAQGETTPGAPPQAIAPADAPEADATEDVPDDSATEQNAEAEQPPAAPEQPGVKSPQQMLQEMQQRQLIMQQQQQGNPTGVYPPAPGMPMPHQPQPPQEQ
jgi:hypothetical protein